MTRATAEPVATLVVGGRVLADDVAGSDCAAGLLGHCAYGKACAGDRGGRGCLRVADHIGN